MASIAKVHDTCDLGYIYQSTQAMVIVVHIIILHCTTDLHRNWTYVLIINLSQDVIVCMFRLYPELYIECTYLIINLSYKKVI